jgi:hypothetical protein
MQENNTGAWASAQDVAWPRASKRLEDYFETGAHGNLFYEFLDTLIEEDDEHELAKNIWLLFTTDAQTTEEATMLDDLRTKIANAFIESEEPEQVWQAWADIIHAKADEQEAELLRIESELQ